MSIDYADATYPVPEDYADSHNRYWARLQSPGAWFTSEQRLAIAKEVRAARECDFCEQRKRALSPYGAPAKHRLTTDLSPIIVDTVHRITTDASRLTREWYESLLADGLTEGEYVEIVGTVVAMVSIDSFARAIGVAHRPLPDAGPGEPTHYIPSTAESTDQAWVPMVPAENAGTPEEDLWVSGKTGNVVRAMSLVPDEVRSLCELSAAHYLPMALVRDAGNNGGSNLSRSQMEIVAGRVSALNECYY